MSAFLHSLPPMNRRTFVSSALATGAALLTGTARLAAQAAAPAAGTFQLNYGPHPGMFKAHAGDDLIDQLKFCADQGFRAFEDNGMRGRPVELQEKMAATMAQLGITMGVFVAMADFKNPTFASPNEAMRDKILADMRASIEVAKRVNAKWVTIVPGCFDLKLAHDFQTANVIDNLRRCAELCEPAGVTMVLEPLNTYRDHPGVFLQDVPQAFALCRAVASPACKILYDLYHAQIQKGNLIPNIDLAWSETPYYQIGDNPGRKEPGTGEINYRNVFRHLHTKGFTGVMVMEHGNALPGKEGELALIRAYRDADNF